MKQNTVIFSGNIGRDAEVRTAGQNKICSFSMGLDNSTKTADGWVNDTIWLKVEYWGQNADKVAAFAKKGQAVSVVGRLGNEKWTDKEGNAKETLKVTAQSVQPYVLFKSNNNVSTPQPQTASVGGDDDLPF